MGSCVSVVCEGTSISLIMILRMALFICLGTINFVQGAIRIGDKKGYTDSMNDFTQDFLAVSWDGLGDNYVFSPFSVHSVLAMLTTGATQSSKTQKQLVAGFGRNGKIELLERMYGQFVKDYKNQTDTLIFGNRVWTTQKYFPKILQSYKQSISKFYDAEFTQLPAEDGEKDVNEWVEKITKGKITNIIDSVPSDTAALIINALYFKASWAKSFEDGKPQEFTMFNDSKVLVNMMTRDSQKQAVAHFSTDLIRGRAVAVAIPYKSPTDAVGRFEMLIIMPENHKGLLLFQYNAKKAVDETDSLGNIIELALGSLENSRKNPSDYIINMPEFKIDSNIGAVGFLQDLGIEKAFDAGEFNGIIEDETLKVSNVKHRAAIEVTKEGTLGVAASSVELVALAAGFSKTVDINKPFLFFVRDTKLNAILFAGKYSNPEWTGQ